MKQATDISYVSFLLLCLAIVLQSGMEASLIRMGREKLLSVQHIVRTQYSPSEVTWFCIIVHV